MQTRYWVERLFDGKWMLWYAGDSEELACVRMAELVFEYGGQWRITNKWSIGVGEWEQNSVT